MDALVTSSPPPKVSAPGLNYSQWQQIHYKYLADQDDRANLMQEIVRRRQVMDKLDQAMGRAELPSVNVVGGPVGEEEQRYCAVMDMELIPAN
jgi:hypothetical protein